MASVVNLSLRVKVALAFLAVYIIWGSTYLAIRFVEESLPPFFMAGTRFLIAGGIFYVWLRLRGASGGTRLDWKVALITGGLMLMGGHGAVVWAEQQQVPSGLVSLLVATVPLWMVLSDWVWNKSKPSLGVIAGLAVGFVGVALLIENLSAGDSYVGLVGGVVVVVGAFLWANGSLFSRSAKPSSSPFLATALEMIVGGSLLLMASVVTGEWMNIRLDLVSTRSLISWVYLIVFGSLVAFTSYIWLLRRTTTAKVSTYSYVNPIVALILGWTLANETLTVRNVLAAGIILASVVIITTCTSEGSSGRKTANRE